jgi:hypothetical protein
MQTGRRLNEPPEEFSFLLNTEDDLGIDLLGDKVKLVTELIFFLIGWVR